MSKGDELQEFEGRGGQVTALDPQEKPKARTRAFPYSGGKRPQDLECKRYPGRRENSPAMKLLKLSLKSVSIMPSTGGGKAIISMQDVAAALAMCSPSSYLVDTDEPDIPFSPAMGYYENYSQVLAEKRITPILNKLSANAYYFALAKYLNDEKAIAITGNNLWYEALELATAEGWKIITGKETFRNAAKLALAQVIDAPALFHCNRCNGSGRNQKGACRHCNGKGRRRISNRAFSDFVEIDEANYRRVWIPRIKRLVQMLKDWDQEVLQHLYHQFSREEG